MGYLLMDNSASGGKRVEADTTWCRHCQAVIDKRKWRQDAGIWYCSKCDGPVCAHCTVVAKENNYTCTPWKSRLDDEIKRAEARERLLGRSNSNVFISGGNL